MCLWDKNLKEKINLRSDSFLHCVAVGTIQDNHLGTILVLNETCVMTSTKMQRDCCFVSPCCLSVCLIRICIQADTTPHKLQVHVCVCVMGFYPTPPIRTYRQQTQTLIFLNKISNKLFPNHSKQLKCHKIDRLYYQYYQTSITRETGTSRWILGIKQGDTDWKTKSDVFQLLLECWDILLQ